MRSRENKSKAAKIWIFLFKALIFIAALGCLIGSIIGIMAVATHGKVITTGGQKLDIELMSICIALLANIVFLCILDGRVYWRYRLLAKFEENELLENHKKAELEK